jgi:hypothetical protein
MSNLRVAEKEKRKGGGGWGYYCLVSIVNEKCYFFLLMSNSMHIIVN